MRRSRFLPCFVAAAAILAVSAVATAQNRSGGAGSFGSSSGASGFGASSFGGASFGGGQSSFGQSSFGQSSFGQSSFGQSSFGQSGLGSSAFGGGGTSFGQATGQTGARVFVGRSAADMAAFFGSTANQSTQGQGQRSQSGGRNKRSDSSSESARPPVRVTISAAPELRSTVAALRPSPSIGSSNAMRLLAQRGVGGVTMRNDAGVVLLEGSVASRSESLLAEKLVAIEPGVRRVENRLVVAGEAEEIPPMTR